MILRILLLSLTLACGAGYAADMGESGTPAVNKRTYPGGADEEDLRVLQSLPEAALKTDTRRIQKDVFKTLYNQELKDESTDAVEE